MKVTGACHCRAITFTAEVDAGAVVACHCTDCQTLSGSPYRVSVPAPVESFKLTGTPKTYVKVADSGNRRLQAFCGDCATPIFGSAETNATVVLLRIGCLDQRNDLKPSRQIWMRSGVRWLGDLARLPGSREA